MSTLEVGRKLVALCREGRHEEATKALYAPEIVSVEAGAPPGQDREAKGLAAVEAKGRQWSEGHQINEARVEGPFPHGDRFAVLFRYDVTRKATGQRIKMDEVALYTVQGGKIVREEFFYEM